MRSHNFRTSALRHSLSSSESMVRVDVRPAHPEPTPSGFMPMSTVRPPPKRHLPPNHPALIRLLSPRASLVFPRAPHSRATLATRTRRVPDCGGHLYEVTCHADTCATASDPLQPPNSVALCGPLFLFPNSSHLRAALASRNPTHLRLQ